MWKRHEGEEAGKESGWKTISSHFFPVVQRFIYDAKCFWAFLGSLNLIYPRGAQGLVEFGSLLRNIRRKIRHRVSYVCPYVAM